MNWLSHCWIQYIVLHDWIIFTHFSKRFLNNWNSQCILILSSDTNVQRLFFKFLCHDTCRVFTGSWSTKISHPHLAVVDRLLKFWLMPGSEARVLTTGWEDTGAGRVTLPATALGQRLNNITPQHSAGIQHLWQLITLTFRTSRRGNTYMLIQSPPSPICAALNSYFNLIVMYVRSIEQFQPINIFCIRMFKN